MLSHLVKIASRISHTVWDWRSFLRDFYCHSPKDFQCGSDPGDSLIFANVIRHENVLYVAGIVDCRVGLLTDSVMSIQASEGLQLIKMLSPTCQRNELRFECIICFFVFFSWNDILTMTMTEPPPISCRERLRRDILIASVTLISVPLRLIFCFMREQNLLALFYFLYLVLLTKYLNDHFVVFILPLLLIF